MADRREGRGRPAPEQAGERLRGAAVFDGGGRTPMTRFREGDDQDDRRMRQIRPQRERGREGPSERERERGCEWWFQRRRRTPVKQRWQGDDPRPI